MYSTESQLGHEINSCTSAMPWPGQAAWTCIHFVCVSVHTLSAGPRAALGTHAHFTFLSKVSHLFSDCHVESQRGKEDGKGGGESHGQTLKVTLLIPR